MCLVPKRTLVSKLEQLSLYGLSLLAMQHSFRHFTTPKHIPAPRVFKFEVVNQFLTLFLVDVQVILGDKSEQFVLVHCL